MAYDVVFTTTFEYDYRGILVYLVDVLNTPVAAGSLLEEIDQMILNLESTPELFAISRKKSLALYSYREYPVKNYVAIYRIENNQVFLIHMFHASQNYEAYV